MISNICEILCIAFLAIDLLLAVSSRLLHCIRLAAFQGLLLGGLAIIHACSGDAMQLSGIVMGALNLAIKGVVIPVFLAKVMRSINVKRELEPYLGYSMSCLTALLLIGISYFICQRLSFCGAPDFKLHISTAFATSMIGLFLVVSRRKAIMQAIGFLIFENGITLFSSGMTVEYTVFVELCILLDVLVLIFIIGIAMYQIKREFNHINIDMLNHLGDAIPVVESPMSETDCEEDD